MTQEATPEGNSRDFPAEDSAASEPQIAAENFGDFPAEDSAASEPQIAAENSDEAPTNDSAISEQQIAASIGTASKPKSEQDKVKITLIGSQRAVVKTIHKLYRMGFAAVGDWSPLQRGKKPGEVISVLICRSQK